MSCDGLTKYVRGAVTGGQRPKELDACLDEDCEHVVRDLYRCPWGYVLAYYDYDNQLVCKPIDDDAARGYIEEATTTSPLEECLEMGFGACWEEYEEEVE